MNDLEDLQEPDARTLAFVAGGLGLDLQLRPEASAEYWRRVAAQLALHDDVGQETRRSFDDLRTILPYGVLCYEVFTLVHDRALLVFELALRERFIDYCNQHLGGTFTLRVDKTETVVIASNFDEVLHAVRGARATARPRLLIAQPSGRTKAIDFNGGLSALREWAQLAGLLEGQRNAVVESAIKEMRNAAAHPGRRHLLMPVSTARTMSDLAEIINHLWGHDTPGGSLYPAPLTRDTAVLAWNTATGDCATSLAANLAGQDGWEQYNVFAIVQAAWRSVDLDTYDSWFETTAHRVDYRWGPGSRADALVWLDEHPPATDTVSVLGRKFMVRVESERVWRAMRPEIAASLPRDLRSGHWYLIGADSADRAFAHVRSVLNQETECGLADTCITCGARNFDQGEWLPVLSRAEISRGATALPPDFHLPTMWGSMRFATRPRALGSGR